MNIFLERMFISKYETLKGKYIFIYILFLIHFKLAIYSLTFTIYVFEKDKKSSLNIISFYLDTRVYLKKRFMYEFMYVVSWELSRCDNERQTAFRRFAYLRKYSQAENQFCLI